MIYKQILKPVWMYGLQLWGCTKKTNINIIQSYQNKVLRGIVNAPWYIRNEDLHRDLHIRLVRKEVKITAAKHDHRLQEHENQQMRDARDVHRDMRRLKRTKPYELK